MLQGGYASSRKLYAHLSCPGIANKEGIRHSASCMHTSPAQALQTKEGILHTAGRMRTSLAKALRQCAL